MDLMEDGNEGDVCRVCRLEGEPDNPLYHPCKCSGSIRYVHSDCLMQWLGHTHRKSCELCGYAFTFKKVFPPDMPTSLPFPVLCRKFLLRTFLSLVFVARAIVVIAAWLAFLPWVTIGIFRGLFAGGTTAAWWISGRNISELTNATSIADSSITQGLNGTSSTNATAQGSTDQAHSFLPFTLLIWRTLKASASADYSSMTRNLLSSVRGLTWPSWRELSALLDSDLGSTIFKGQIITVATIVIFLAVFLLREWIFQNMPQVQAHQAEEVPAPPRLEEWRPDMAVRWRRRRVERARELGQLPQRLPPLPLLRPRPRRLPDDGQLLHPADALDAGLADRYPELREMLIERDGPRRQDEWEDMPDEGAVPVESALQEEDRPTGQDGRATDSRHQRAAVTSGEDEIFVERPDAARMREARNRYFAVEDHNRDFTGQADFVAGGSSNPQASASAPPADPAPILLNHPVVQPRRRSPRLNPDVQDTASDPGAPSSSVDQQLPNGTRAKGLGSEQQDNSDSSSFAAEVQPPQQPPLREVREALLLAQDGGAEEPRPDDEADEAEEGDEEVQIGPGPDDAMFDEEFGDEGGLILEGDVEGILDGIGLIGSPYTLIQNVFLVLTVLACCLTIFVELPYVIGKIHLLADTGLLLRMVKLPIRFVRLVTDPFVDILLEITRDLVIKPLKNRLETTTGEVDSSSISGLGHSFRAVRALFDDQILPILHSAWSAPQRLMASLASNSGSESQTFVPWSADTITGKNLRAVEDQFGKLGSASVSTWKSLSGGVWKRFAPDTTKVRIAAIAVGYTDAILAAVGLAALGEKGLGQAGAAIAAAVTHYGVVLKLGFFMAIELAVFPLVMGAFLDVCFLPLFAGATIHGRALMTLKYPLLSFFAHWLAGTLFMFAFARCIATCRSVCRKGAMYSIRDPQDPNFSPVRDILEKKSSTHMWKLLVSLGMYLSVLAGPLGSVLLMLKHQPFMPMLLPLRWHIQQPLSDVPYDFLLLLLVVPYHVSYLRIHKVFEAGVTAYWHGAAARLRLSSYMKGIRYSAQEGITKFDKVVFAIVDRYSALVRLVWKDYAGWETFRGGYVRVPYADQVALVRPRKTVFIPVNEDGTPLSQAGMLEVLRQVQAAQKKGRDHRRDYCMVYLPPLYTLRFWIFGISLWTAIAWTVTLSLVTPLVVGRLATGAFVDRALHDGYSLLAGGYICYGAYSFSRWVRKRVAAIVKNATEAGRYRYRSTLQDKATYAATKALRLARVAYSAVVLGVFMPIGFALAVDLYVLLPAKYGLSDMTPVFYVQEAWALGLCLMALVYLRRPMRQWVINLLDKSDELQLRPAPWFRHAVKPRNINQRLLFPACRILFMLYTVPAALAWLISTCLGWSSDETALLCRMIYPAILSCWIARYAGKLARYRLSRWSKRALETEFHVQQIVKDFDGHASISTLTPPADDTADHVMQLLAGDE